MSDKLVEHKQFIHDKGIDLPEVANWKWEGK
jgi:xylulose-5-phosphate/fructose-6-phosphate phosphoketolase